MYRWRHSMTKFSLERFHVQLIDDHRIWQWSIDISLPLYRFECFENVVRHRNQIPMKPAIYSNSTNYSYHLQEFHRLIFRFHLQLNSRDERSKTKNRTIVGRIFVDRGRCCIGNNSGCKQNSRLLCWGCGYSLTIMRTSVEFYSHTNCSPTWTVGNNSKTFG